MTFVIHHIFEFGVTSLFVVCFLDRIACIAFEDHHSIHSLAYNCALALAVFYSIIIHLNESPPSNVHHELYYTLTLHQSQHILITMTRFLIASLLTLLPTTLLAFTTTHHTSTTTTTLYAKNAQDQTRNAPSWTQPPTPTTITTSDVTSTTMAGGDSSGAMREFEPPKQANSWTNVMDTPRGESPRDLPSWARQG